MSTLAGGNLPCVLVAAKDELGMCAGMETKVASALSDLQVGFFPPGLARVWSVGLLLRV